MKNYLQILKDNSEVKEGSFLYFLHEEYDFNETSFWSYYESIREATRNSLNKVYLDQEVCVLISRTYSYVLRSIISSLSTEDLYIMNKLPEGKLSDFIERLDRAFIGYFQGYVLDESLFDDELINPYSSSIETKETL